jgi:ipoprotein LpqH
MPAEKASGRLNSKLNFAEIAIHPSSKAAYSETVRQRRRAATTTKENRVKRSIAVAAAATAIVVTGLSGCSSTPGQKVSTSGHAKVVIDGLDQNVQGQVTCQKAGGQLQIGIGQPGTQTAVAVQATDANPPAVHQIALGNVNGVTLAYQQGSPGASAQATEDGNGYKFTGTATGINTANPMAGTVSKSFEIDVTCP